MKPSCRAGGARFWDWWGPKPNGFFRRGDILSVTISAATGMAANPADVVAELIWRELAAHPRFGPAPPIPPCRVIKEQRATIAQTPAQAALRPGPATGNRQSLAGRRLDRHGPAGHHRRRHSIGPGGRETRAQRGIPGHSGLTRH